MKTQPPNLDGYRGQYRSPSYWNTREQANTFQERLRLRNAEGLSRVGFIHPRGYPVLVDVLNEEIADYIPHLKRRGCRRLIVRPLADFPAVQDFLQPESEG